MVVETSSEVLRLRLLVQGVRRTLKRCSSKCFRGRASGKQSPSSCACDEPNAAGGRAGRRAEARELLAPVDGWFTEGFDSTDLKDAKTLLDQPR